MWSFSRVWSTVELGFQVGFRFSEEDKAITVLFKFSRFFLPSYLAKPEYVADIYRGGSPLALSLTVLPKKLLLIFGLLIDLLRADEVLLGYFCFLVSFGVKIYGPLKELFIASYSLISLFNFSFCSFRYSIFSST